MKVVIVSSSDIEGGAAIASYRLFTALLHHGINAEMVVQKKLSDHPKVYGPITNIEKSINVFRPYVDRLFSGKTKRGSKQLFSPATLSFSKLAKRINARNPDVVHLHWVCDGAISISDLAKIKAPIVWSLHDMWPFTGGCHYASTCERYKRSCRECPALGSVSKIDKSTKLQRKKHKLFQSLDFTFIGLSAWISMQARQSQLLRNAKVVCIPNTLDTSKFKELNPLVARRLWNIPLDKKVILFGAMNSLGDERKGYRELSAALKILKKRNDIFLMVFGASFGGTEQLPIQARYSGILRDDISLITLYSLATVSVVPSLEENLSNVIMESMSCGTPVVAFNIGGNKDMIDHKSNGYLAEYADSEDLAKGIEWIIDQPDDSYRKRSRDKIVKTFTRSVVTPKYIELYCETVKHTQT